MKVVAKISSKGQVTLPREVRKKLGLKQGDGIVFNIEDAGVTLTTPQEDNPFDAFIGTLPPLPKDAKTYWRELRDGDAEE